jgi:hypothetical protein
MKYKIVIRDKKTNKILHFFNDAAAFLHPNSPTGSDAPFKQHTTGQALALILDLLAGNIVQNADMVIELRPPQVHVAIELKSGNLENIVTDSDDVFFSCIDWDSLLEEGETNEFTDYDEYLVLSPVEFDQYMENPEE